MEDSRLLCDSVCCSHQTHGLLSTTCSHNQMEVFSIQMIVSMMWQMTVSRSSQTLRMVMDIIMVGEMVLVGALWAQAVLIPSGVLFGIVWFVSKVSLYDPQSGIRWETPHFVWDLWHTNPMVTYQ